MQSSSFPLPWEQVRWQSRRCAISDFRLVVLRRGAVVSEMALHDIADIEVEPSPVERATGIGTVLVRSKREADAPLRIARTVRARRTALTLKLLVADVRGVPPDESVAGLPLPSIWRIPPAIELKAALIGPSLLLLMVVAILIGLSTHDVQVAIAADDPIRPHGLKRSRAEIDQFMESEVMPFARYALEPVVGRGNVTCLTCHGKDAEARGWKMPAVTALPEPAVRHMATTAGSDSQVRNALHGYLAQDHKQRIAAHMRGVVLPGMAALLRRPVYDFAQPYEYNQERAAFGCYHCHMVKS